MLSPAQQKIKGQHLQRLAVVYLRQSSARQVRENFRSTERQYGLAEEAVRLGWEPERVVTIDGDLGISGRDAHPRKGRSARSSGLRSRAWRAHQPRRSGCLSTAG
jgi:hypothetical protein